MPDKAKVAGKRVVVVGGGDSGLESAQTAHEAGAQVTMLQVLERFTGMESNIDLVNQMEIPRHFNTRVKALETENGAHARGGRADQGRGRAAAARRATIWS